MYPFNGEPILALLLILAGHFVGDFMWQSDRMAQGKSKSLWVLAQHVGAYSVAIFFVSLVVAPPVGLLRWALTYTAVTAMVHYGIDAVTSRWTSKLWFVKTTEAGMAWREVDFGSQCQKVHWVDWLPSRHNFFVVIGFDQYLHALQLGLLLRWMW